MFQITINVSSAEELAALAAKLSGQTEAVPIQHQPTMQQYQTVQQPSVQPSVQPPVQPQQPQYQTGQAPTAPTQPAPTGQAPTQPPVQQSNQTSTAPATTTAPTAAAPTYTAQQLGVAAQPIVDAGRSGELIAWLNQKGAGALTQLDPQHYGEFATFLRGLGCQI